MSTAHSTYFNPDSCHVQVVLQNLNKLFQTVVNISSFFLTGNCFFYLRLIFEVLQIHLHFETFKHVSGLEHLEQLITWSIYVSITLTLDVQCCILPLQNKMLLCCPQYFQMFFTLHMAHCMFIYSHTFSEACFVSRTDPSTVPHVVKKKQRETSRPSHRPGSDWLKEMAPSHRANLLQTLTSQ